ncbi:hypothetical protein DFH06DRAFT_1245522 [Mycena polygramma]|nr:hypothetical protein DFH06DRAFT_1245522 [Mycena polygramma]
MDAQYAANEADAEAGGPGQGWGFKARDEENTPISSDPADLEADGPFTLSCTDNAPIWKLYMDQAKISDDNLANTFNSDLDPLLIFAGLFSAILSAFLIEIRKGLQEDWKLTSKTE